MLPTMPSPLLALGALEAGGLDDIPQIDRADDLIGHLDAHGGDLVGNGGDAHVHHAKGQSQIPRQVGHPGQLHALFQLDIVAGHGGAVDYAHDGGADAEAVQSRLQPLAVELDLFSGVHHAAVAAAQQLHRRELVGGLLVGIGHGLCNRLGLPRQFFLLHLGLGRLLDHRGSHRRLLRRAGLHRCFGLAQHRVFLLLLLADQLRLPGDLEGLHLGARLILALAAHRGPLGSVVLPAVVGRGSSQAQLFLFLLAQGHVHRVAGAPGLAAVLPAPRLLDRAFLRPPRRLVYDFGFFFLVLLLPGVPISLTPLCHGFPHAAEEPPESASKGDDQQHQKQGQQEGKGAVDAESAVEQSAQVAAQHAGGLHQLAGGIEGGKGVLQTEGTCDLTVLLQRFQVLGEHLRHAGEDCRQQQGADGPVAHRLLLPIEQEDAGEEKRGHRQPEAPAHQALDQIRKEGDKFPLRAEIADDHEDPQGQQDHAPEPVVGTGRLLDLLLDRFGPGVLLGRGTLAGGRAAPGSGLSGAGFCTFLFLSHSSLPFKKSSSE